MAVARGSLSIRGSVLGHTFWNMLHDEVLRFVQLEGINLVVFADDIGCCDDY